MEKAERQIRDEWRREGYLLRKVRYADPPRYRVVDEQTGEWMPVEFTAGIPSPDARTLAECKEARTLLQGLDPGHAVLIRAILSSRISRGRDT
jgi:hypothetical protein